MEYVLLFFLVEYWIGCNIAVINTMTKQEMEEDFITNQNLLGKICVILNVISEVRFKFHIYYNDYYKTNI